MGVWGEERSGESDKCSVCKELDLKSVLPKEQTKALVQAKRAEAGVSSNPKKLKLKAQDNSTKELPWKDPTSGQVSRHIIILKSIPDESQAQDPLLPPPCPAPSGCQLIDEIICTNNNSNDSNSNSGSGNR